MNRYVCPGSNQEIWIDEKCYKCSKNAVAYWIEDLDVIACDDHLVGDYFRELGKPMCPTCGAEMEMID